MIEEVKAYKIKGKSTVYSSRESAERIEREDKVSELFQGKTIFEVIEYIASHPNADMIIEAFKE